MIHFVMNGVYHPIYHLGNQEQNYVTAITKIQGSSILVCTDSILRRVYLFDLHRSYGPDIEEVYGYHLNDLSVSSAVLLDEYDGVDSVCGDICVDASGHNLYALILSKAGGAWIKIYKILTRKIYFTGIRYAVPYSPNRLKVSSLNRSGLQPTKKVPGLPAIYNNLCYGTGLEIKDGVLFILTRRRIPFTYKSSSGTYNASTQVSMLTCVMPHNGELIANYPLSVSSIEGDVEGDAVFHGLAKVDGRLITQVRYDHNILRTETSLWSVESNRFISERGQTALVMLDDPVSTGVSSMTVVPYDIMHYHFPYGLAMAYSITTDQGDRKLYSVWGNQVWDFEIMDYTFIVRYPEYDDDRNVIGYAFFEGDIIDLGDIIKDDVRTELQCFLRNDSSHDMIDTKITLELDGEDKRQDDIFISLTQTSFGYKHLDLGTIVPGGSKEFWIETHPLNVGQVEVNKTHRLPIRVTYQTTSDEY